MALSALRGARTRSLAIAARAVCASRASSTAAPTPADMLTVQKDATSGIAVLSMHKRPVNALNLEFLTELGSAIRQLEGDKSVRGLILASDVKNIFSAGLDILEMYKPEPVRLEKFWRSLQDTWMALYGTRLATVAAIEGEAPAGGCMLAMSCDYRVAAPGYKMGLNETKLGIVAPFWFIDVMKNTIGHRHSERLLELGAMAGTEEALRIGLIDETVAKEQVRDRAREVLTEQFFKVPDVARSITKKSIRRETIQRLQKNVEEDVANFCKFSTADATQAFLERYMEQLRKKGK